MWVFDGEEWVETDKGSSTPSRIPDREEMPDWEMFPELQIIEEPALRRERDNQPVFPFTIP